MKLRAAVCLNLSLNISEFLTAFLRIVSSSFEESMPGIRDTSIFLEVPIMKLSSDIVTDALAPVIFEIL